MTEDEMVGWHHRLNGHKVEQALGDGKGQGSLVGCSPKGHKELDMTEQLNNRKYILVLVKQPLPFLLHGTAFHVCLAFTLHQST